MTPDSDTQAEFLNPQKRNFIQSIIDNEKKQTLKALVSVDEIKSVNERLLELADEYHTILTLFHFYTETHEHRTTTTRMLLCREHLNQAIHFSYKSEDEIEAMAAQYHNLISSIAFANWQMKMLIHRSNKSLSETQTVVMGEMKKTVKKMRDAIEECKLHKDYAQHALKLMKETPSKDQALDSESLNILKKLQGPTLQDVEPTEKALASILKKLDGLIELQALTSEFIANNT
jgi:hypothetical protein